MSDEITFAGKPFVSSKRASKISGYAQDYIGQLARSGQIDAQRISGLWYVSMDSLLNYRKPAAGQSIPTPEPKSEDSAQAPLSASADVDSFISFDGKDYISASRAAKLTGYNQDYVGQLARSGQILARQIGNRWYVDREGLVAHKNEKDALLAAVQAESVGLPDAAAKDEPAQEEKAVPAETEMTYYPDERDLLPKPQKQAEPEVKQYEWNSSEQSASAPESLNAIPIRLIKHSAPISPREERKMPSRVQKRSRFASTGMLAAAALTVVIVLSFGITSLKSNSTYVLKPLLPGKQAFTAAAERSFEAIAERLEALVSPEITFTRE